VRCVWIYHIRTPSSRLPFSKLVLYFTLDKDVLFRSLQCESYGYFWNSNPSLFAPGCNSNCCIYPSAPTPNFGCISAQESTDANNFADVSIWSCIYLRCHQDGTETRLTDGMGVWMVWGLLGEQQSQCVIRSGSPLTWWISTHLMDLHSLDGSSLTWWISTHLMDLHSLDGSPLTWWISTHLIWNSCWLVLRLLSHLRVFPSWYFTT
jgi:hypothetical protein